VVLPLAALRCFGLRHHRPSHRPRHLIIVGVLQYSLIKTSAPTSLGTHLSRKNHSQRDYGCRVSRCFRLRHEQNGPPRTPRNRPRRWRSSGVPERLAKFVALPARDHDIDGFAGRNARSHCPGPDSHSGWSLLLKGPPPDCAVLQEFFAHLIRYYEKTGRLGQTNN